MSDKQSKETITETTAKSSFSLLREYLDGFDKITNIYDDTTIGEEAPTVSIATSSESTTSEKAISKGQ